MFSHMHSVVDQTVRDDYASYNVDNVDGVRGLPDDSVGLIVTSPPFPGMYVYNNTPRDIGNSRNMEEMLEHFKLLAGSEGLLRVLMPGRTCCVHLANVPATMVADGYIGLHDFRGDMVRAMVSLGWTWQGEVTIDKDPQLKAIRTKDRGLLFKSLGTDASVMRTALPDYLLMFRKPGSNDVPIRAGMSEKYNAGGGWITAEDWIEWAAPVWYRKSPHMPGGIRETDVLKNFATARDDKDEKHLCPLQLGVIDRAVMLWSNPGDVVMDPFSGIASTGYQAILRNRKYVGFELKPSYYRVGVANLNVAVAKSREDHLPLFKDEIGEVAEVA
jgi:DNA modification methylase